MNQISVSIFEKLPDGVEDRIERGHIRDEAAKGIVCNYKRFHIVANNQNEITGVLTAYTAFSEVYVDDIWVDPSYRKQGIGNRLLEELEQRFSDKGYNNINLVTSEFSGAADFYKKCGFDLEFVRVNEKNNQLTKYFFIKYFSNAIQHQGIAK